MDAEKLIAKKEELLAKSLEDKGEVIDIYSAGADKKQKNRERALRAWETRKERGYKSKPQEKEYTGTGKVRVRNNIIRYFKKYIRKDKYILTLESPDFYFVKRFPNWVKFIIFEKEKKQFLKMLEDKPKNVDFLILGDISKSDILRVDFNLCFLDFVGTYESSKQVILNILTLLTNCDVIAFTFCLRNNKKELEDYKFDIVRKMGYLFPYFNITYGEAYRDGAPMISILLKNVHLQLQSSKPKNKKEKSCLCGCGENTTDTWSFCKDHRLLDGVKVEAGYYKYAHVSTSGRHGFEGRIEVETVRLIYDIVKGMSGKIYQENIEIKENVRTIEDCHYIVFDAILILRILRLLAIQGKGRSTYYIKTYRFNEGLFSGY